MGRVPKFEQSRGGYHSCSILEGTGAWRVCVMMTKDGMMDTPGVGWERERERVCTYRRGYRHTDIGKRGRKGALVFLSPPCRWGGGCPQFFPKRKDHERTDRQTKRMGTFYPAAQVKEIEQVGMVGGVE